MAQRARTENETPALQERLPDIAADAFIVVTVPVVDATKTSVETVRSLAARGFSCVYVSLSNDYISVSSLLEEAGVDLRRIKFVDATSRMYGIAPVESPEVVYVDGPLSTDSIIDGIGSCVRAIGGDKRVVLFDSLSTLLLYNTTDAALAFEKTLKNLLKKEGAAGIVVLAHGENVNDDLVSKLKKNGGEVVKAGE